MEQVFKEMYGTDYKETCGVLSVLDANTGSFKTVREKGVFGRFARVKQLNGFKSRQNGAPVYDECVICQIKISSSVNKDVVSHKVTGVKGAELKKRFAESWADFEKLEKAAIKADAEKKAAAQKAALKEKEATEKKEAAEKETKPKTAQGK